MTTQSHAMATLTGVEGNAQTVRRTFQQLLNGGQLAAAEELYAPDVVFHASDGEELHGWAAIQQVVANYRRAFPDVVATVHELVAEGDRVAARFSAEGTHLGALHGVAPTGRRMQMSGLALYHLRDGRIVEEWEGMCRLGMLEQLGAPPRA